MHLASQHFMSLLSKGLKSSTCPKHGSLIQTLGQGAPRTFKIHYTHCSMEKIINIMGENADRASWNIWSDDTIESAVVVLEKATNVIKPKAINYCWRKLCPDVHHSTGFRTQSIKEIMNETVNMWEKKKIYIYMCVRVCVCVNCSVVPDSLRSHGLQPTRVLCPWDFPGKDTGVGCHFLLQYIHMCVCICIYIWRPKYFKIWILEKFKSW